MKNLISKLVPLVAFSATTAFAGIGDRIDTLEQEMQQITATTPQDTLGTSFTTATPEIKGGPWFATFDIIYWHIKMGGTEYAYSVSQFSNATPLPLNGDTKDNDFDWDWGLKVGLGYKTPHDNWDVYARYTWYETNDTDDSTKPFPSTLIALDRFDFITASRAKSHIDVDYNNVDFELARSYFLSSKLSFRPHIGVKSAWIDINQRIFYTASSQINTLVHDGGLDFKTTESVRFWGLGPRAGLDSKWYLGYNFHIFGDVAASVLYGYFKDNHSEYFPRSHDPDLPHGKVVKLKHKFHRYVPFAQMFLGLGWENHINNDKQHLGIKLGYEVQYYWRVNQAHQIEDNTNASDGSFRLQSEKQSEDIMFYGITGEFRLDF